MPNRNRNAALLAAALIAGAAIAMSLTAANAGLAYGVPAFVGTADRTRRKPLNEVHD